MNNLQIFNNEEFGEIRTLIINDEPYFVAKDISEKLGYSETNAMTKRLDDDEFISDKLEGMNMKSIFINESGLYNAVLGSKLPEAKKFKKWITSDVLPSIRKHGMYATEELLNNPDLIIQIATQLKEEKTKNKALEEEKKRNEPKLHYHDWILNSPSLMPITSISKDYGMTAEEMNKLLKDLKVQYKMGEQWILYRKYDNKGYVSSKPLTIKHKSKPTEVKNQTQWTQKGRKFIYDLLKENNILPLIEKEVI